MKEFKLLIRNQAERPPGFAEKSQEFLQACEAYIQGLKAKGQLLGAQPLEREGVMLSGKPGSWKESPFKEGNEVIVGYYHIVAENLGEAVAIAKGNPEFAFTDTARVEVRPIKGSEKSTGYVYPKQA